MRKAATVVALLSITVIALAQRPAGLSVYTWTREDIFAGLIEGDFERLNGGIGKLEEILKQNPKDADALAMKAAGLSALALRDLQKGDAAGFNRQYDEAIRLLDEAYRLDPKSMGVNAVYGGVTLYNYGKLPEPRRAHALQMARRSYNYLYSAQEKALPNMPLHLKGEVLAGVAEAEWRSGNTTQAEAYLKRMLEIMPGTPYAARAQQWVENPSSITPATRLVCQTCHDPGRLKNVLAAR